MNCLVTGGAGFIGSHIVKALVDRGDRVRVIDNFSSGKRDNLKEVLPDIELVEGDIRDADVTRSVATGITAVFHLAAVPSVPRSIQEPRLTHQVNVDGTFNMLMAAKDAGVSRFVFSSSSSIYGDTETLPKIEDMIPMPKSPYALQKLIGEQYSRIFSEIYGISTICLRYFNVFGPRQNPESEYAAVIPRFITSMINDRPPTIYGDGTQTRDFTYVSNAVSANLLAAEKDSFKGEIVNISTGIQLDLNSLAKKVGEIVNRDYDPIYEASRPGDVKHSLGGIKKAKDLLGYRVVTPLDQGLVATYEAFSSYRA
ncbi:MAG: SDR family oxidoreductase [Deltaproteobacteria bacterium]|nr:SDR family oxidoreductase [Candidatus Zymogenaceae bacterium]